MLDAIAFIFIAMIVMGVGMVIVAGAGILFFAVSLPFVIAYNFLTK
jgi:hypothetical protein